MKPHRLLVPAVIAAALLGAGCSRTAPPADEARLEPDGSVFVAAAGSDRFVPADRSRAIRHGDRVKVTEGSARVVNGTGETLELAARTEMRLDRRPELIKGRMLVSSSERPYTVVAGPARARTHGDAQVRRELGTTVESYRGTVTISTVGRSLEVPALRRAAVPALGLLPRLATPLRYDASDRWDRRFLAPAIEFGEQLEAVSRGLEAQVPAGEGRTPGFYRVLLPDLEAEPDLDRLLDPDRDRGETLVGAAIALSTRTTGFAERWSATFAFRDEGAHWGLVALDQRAVSPRVADALYAALRVGLSPSGPIALAPPAPPARAPLPTTSETAEPPPSDPPPRRPEPPSLPPPAAPEPAGGILAPVVDPVVDVVDGLLGGLLGVVLGRR